MTSLIEKVQQSSPASKLIVFGYIREAENKVIFQNMPRLICYLCVIHYCHGEYFEVSRANASDYKLSADQTKVTLIKSNPSAYINLHHLLDSDKFNEATWEFKILKCLWIGIILRNKVDTAYQLFINTWIVKNEPMMKITLDMKNSKMIVFTSNETRSLNLTKRKKCNIWQLSIALMSTQDSIVLIDFCIH